MPGSRVNDGLGSQDGLDRWIHFQNSGTLSTGIGISEISVPTMISMQEARKPTVFAIIIIIDIYNATL